MIAVIDTGGISLMLVSALAATLVPLSSEAAVFAAVGAGMNPTEALIWASVGNCIGVTINYALGRWGREQIVVRSLQGKWAQRTLQWMERHGWPTLLLSWLPFVGDPLTLVAGLSKIPFPLFALFAYGTRILRYWVLLFLVGSN